MDQLGGLESHLPAHPAVLDAAVVGISDGRWQERPLAVVAFAASTRSMAETWIGFPPAVAASPRAAA